MLEFTAVKREHLSQLNEFLSNIPPYFTEHSFTTLLAWQKSHNFEFAIESEVLYLKTTYNGMTSFFPPVLKMTKPQSDTPWEPVCVSDEYKAKYKEALETLKNYSEQVNTDFILSEVGETDLPLIEELLPDYFEIEEDRDNANYIYHVQDLSELKGKSYHSRRNHLNAFKRKYPNYQYLSLTAELVVQCQKLVEQWLENNPNGSKTTIEQELTALNVLFNNFCHLGLKGSCIMIDDKIEAFAIGEPLSNQICAILIEKANTEFRGLYPAINQMFLQDAWQDYKYVNRAEDMGLPGLRKTKLDYLPCHLAMKYILKAK